MDRSRLVRTVWISSLVGCAISAVAFLAWMGWKTSHGKLEYERVRTLAANLANDEFEMRFRRRPFWPEMYEARLVDDRWHWGRFDPAYFFSTQVSFRNDATDLKFAFSGRPTAQLHQSNRDLGHHQMNRCQGFRLRS
jgi:hypothetical protein